MVCCVFGGLGTIGAAIGLAWYVLIAAGLLDTFMKWLASLGPTTNPTAGITSHIMLVIVAEAVKLALAIALLASGVGLLRRRPGSVPLARVWAVAKIVATIVGTTLGMWIQQDAIRAAVSGSNLPPNAPANMPVFMMGGAIIGGLFAIAWGCALPAFMLIWLSRGRVRAETARWASAPR